MDATIHQLLHEKADGHTRLCEALGSKGIGLKDANLYFRSPSTQGPRLVYSITGIDWSNRSLTIRHEADIGTRRVLEGHAAPQALRLPPSATVRPHGARD